MATKTRLSDVTLDEVSLVDNPAAHLSKVVLMKRDSGDDDVCKKAKGIQFNIGFKEDGGSDVQSVVFDSKEWDEDGAKKWLIAHKMKSGKVDVTENTLRYRQADPSGYVKFRMITPGAQVAKALRQDQSISRAQMIIEQALAERFHEKGPEGYVMRPWIRDMYEDTVIYDYNGSTFRVDYELDMEEGEFKVVLGESVQVTVAYVDKKDTMPKEKKTEDPDKADEALVARLSATEQKFNAVKDGLKKLTDCRIGASYKKNKKKVRPAV